MTWHFQRGLPALHQLSDVTSSQLLEDHLLVWSCDCWVKEGEKGRRQRLRRAYTMTCMPENAHRLNCFCSALFWPAAVREPPNQNLRRSNLTQSQSDVSATRFSLESRWAVWMNALGPADRGTSLSSGRVGPVIVLLRPGMEPGPQRGRSGQPDPLPSTRDALFHCSSAFSKENKTKQKKKINPTHFTFCFQEDFIDRKTFVWYSNRASL